MQRFFFKAIFKAIVFKSLKILQKNLPRCASTNRESEHIYT
jgi:hypothetical protein